MRRTRLTITSAIYGVREKLHAEGLSTDSSLSGFPFVNVTTSDKAYTPWSAPCVVVYSSTAYDRALQLGGGFWNQWILHFDVYANTEGQIQELTDIVWDYCRGNMHVYRYDEKQPTYQVLSGSIRTVYLSGAPTLVCDALLDKRAVTFMPRQDTIGEATAHAAQITVEVTSSTD
jgi:hypothetical protein